MNRRRLPEDPAPPPGMQRLDAVARSVRARSFTVMSCRPVRLHVDPNGDELEEGAIGTALCSALEGAAARTPVVRQVLCAVTTR